MALLLASGADAARQRNCFDNQGPGSLKWQKGRSYERGTFCLQDDHGYRLVWQADGNLVWYTGGPGAIARWASNTMGRGARLVLRPDGNVAVASRGGHVLWSTRRTGGTGYRPLKGSCYAYLATWYVEPSHHLANDISCAPQTGELLWERVSDPR